MKYYLIKAIDNADIQWICDKAHRFEHPSHIRPICIELEEDELKLIELFTNMFDIEQRVYKELYPWLNNTNRLKAHAKIRKVLAPNEIKNS